MYDSSSLPFLSLSLFSFLFSLFSFLLFSFLFPLFPFLFSKKILFNVYIQPFSYDKPTTLYISLFTMISPFTVLNQDLPSSFLCLPPGRKTPYFPPPPPGRSPPLSPPPPFDRSMYHAKPCPIALIFGL